MLPNSTHFFLIIIANNGGERRCGGGVGLFPLKEIMKANEIDFGVRLRGPVCGDTELWKTNGRSERKPDCLISYSLSLTHFLLLAVEVERSYLTSGVQFSR